MASFNTTMRRITKMF